MFPEEVIVICSCFTNFPFTHRDAADPRDVRTFNTNLSNSGLYPVTTSFKSRVNILLNLRLYKICTLKLFSGQCLGIIVIKPNWLALGNQDSLNTKVLMFENTYINPKNIFYICPSFKTVCWNCHRILDEDLFYTVLLFYLDWPWGALEPALLSFDQLNPLMTLSRFWECIASSDAIGCDMHSLNSPALYCKHAWILLCAVLPM